MSMKSLSGFSSFAPPRNNMGGNPEWDNRMVDSLKNFDLSSPEIKQQFGKF